MHDEVAHVPGSPAVRVSDPGRLRGYRTAAWFLAVNVALFIVGDFLWGVSAMRGVVVLEALLAVWLFRRGRYAGAVTIGLVAVLALDASFSGFGLGLPFGVLNSAPHLLHAGAFVLALWGKPTRLRIGFAIAAYVISIGASYLRPYYLFSVF